MRSAMSSRTCRALPAVELRVGERGHRVVDAPPRRPTRGSRRTRASRPPRAPLSWPRPTARSTAGRSAVSIIARVRSERGPVQQLVADVAEGHDVVGDDLRVDLGDLRLAAQEQALELERPDLPRLDRLEDHPDAEPVGHVADDHAADRQHPPLVGSSLGHEGHRDAEQEAEEEAEVDDEPQLLARRPRGRSGWPARGSPPCGGSPSA